MTTLATPLAPMPSRRRAAPRRSSLSNKTNNNTTATARKPSPPRRTPKRSNTSTLALSKMARVINIWRDLSLRKKNSDGRIKRSNSLKLIKPKVVFREPIHPIQSDDPDAIIHDVYVDVLEFDPREAVKTISDETWVTQPHEDIPWYEQPYEELPWWEYPDLEEDDEITAHVKEVIRESSGKNANYNCEKWIQGHADRVEALVVTFVLKLKHRVAFTEFQKEQERLLRTQQLQHDAQPEFEDVSLGGDSHDPSYAVVGGSVDSRENYGSVESDSNRRSSLQSIDEKSAQEAPLPIAATKTTTTNTGPIRQDEQELMRKLLNPSPSPAATSSTKPKITKEDVAKMVLPRRTKKLPRRTRSGTSQQSHSVLDDDSVSLHSAVMSTGWNKLNIHNSELKRYRKNHRSFHRAAASPTARRMWADDHTVMINSGRNTTGDDDDVKSVASFQSSPAMMEYSRTRQNWMQFNPHSHRKREPKRVFRLTTSATSTWLDDSASEHTNETGASDADNLHASLSSLGGGNRRKKKKKKKKKVGHLAMFMAKEELRGGASESNIFDIMEEEAEERDQSPPPQRASEPPPKKSSLGFLDSSSPPKEEEEEDEDEENLDDSNDALNFSHNENDGDDSEQPANLDDSDNCLQLDDDSDNQVHHSDDDSSAAAGVHDDESDDSDAVVQEDDDSDAVVEAEEDGENSSHKSDSSDKMNLEHSNASLQESQDSDDDDDDNSDNESMSSSSSSSSSSKGSLNWKQDEEEKKEAATEEVNANKKIGDSSSTLGRSSTSTSSTTDKSSSKSATAETNRPVQGGRVSDLVNKKENEKEKSDAMAEWQVAVLRMKRNSQEGPIQRTSVANRAAAFEKNNGTNEKKPLTSPPPARITAPPPPRITAPPPRITPTITHDKKPIPVQPRIAPLTSKVDSKPVPVQPRIAPLPSKADSKEPPFRQRATRRASGSGISLFSMRLPESGPRTASTMTPTESSRGSKAKEESITDASSNKRPPSPPPKKTKPKHKPFITRRASFSDIQVRVDSDLFGDKKPRKTSMNDDDPKMRLVMLRHAAMCTQTQRGAVCPSDPKCSQMKELLRHMMGCKHQSTMVPCNFPGCHESKEFLIMMHKTSQILAQQRDAQKDLPPMVCIPTSTSKVGEKSEEEGGDDGDDLSDIGSFGSAGGGMDDKDDHDDDSDKQEKKTATMESSAHRRSLSPKPTGQRRTTWAPTTSPTRPKPVLKDPVLIEKMKKEEEEKEKIQADLKKRHEAVKARVQAKLQNAQAQKRELDAAKFIRDAENRTRSQALIMQQRRSERSNAETDTPLMQRRKSEKTMEAEKSAPVLRRRSEMPVSSTTQQNALPPRRITPTPEDEKRLKEQEELRRKHAELKAKMDKAKVERAEKEAVRAMGKIKPVRGMSLPTNPGRMGYVDRSSLRAAAPTSPVRTPAPTSTKVLPTNTGRGRRAAPAAPPTTKTSPKAAPKKTASPPKVIERVDKETGRKKLASEVVYENQIEATSAVARLKAAKLAKKAKKSKKGSDI